MDTVHVRPATPEDAARIAEMSNALNRQHGLDDTMHTAATIHRDGFGAEAAFTALVAEQAGAIIGYANYHGCYNSDLAARGLWLVDLYVEASARNRGVGRALMAALAREALAQGAVTLSWGVDADNDDARAMYARLGAHDWDYRILEFHEDDLHRMAAELPQAD